MAEIGELLELIDEVEVKVRRAEPDYQIAPVLDRLRDLLLSPAPVDPAPLVAKATAEAPVVEWKEGDGGRQVPKAKGTKRPAKSASDK